MQMLAYISNLRWPLSQLRDQLVAQTNNDQVCAFENALRRGNAHETNQVRRDLEKAGPDLFLLDAFEKKVRDEMLSLEAEKIAKQYRPHEKLSVEELIARRTRLQIEAQQLPKVKRTGRPRKNAAEELQQRLETLEQEIRDIEIEWQLRNFDKFRAIIGSAIDGVVVPMPTKPCLG
jgi:hypothetical protein